MKVLMLCNTYNMLLAAIQIKRYDLSDDNVDIIISDYSNNAEEISNNLKKTQLFDNIYFAKVKEIYQGGNFIHKVRKTLLLFEKSENVKRKFQINNFNYDAFYFVNYDIPANQLYNQIKKCNPVVEVHRFEEGYSTYIIKNDYILLEYITKIVSMLTGKDNLINANKILHLYEPELLIYQCDYEVKSIKKYSKDEVEDKRLLNEIFNYKNEADEYEKYKFIIFEESFCVDKKEKINDYAMFKFVIDLVGGNNVIIKMHPRNNNKRFQDIKIGKNNIPWEIIQMNGCFNKSIFITISSGAVLSSRTWLNDNIQSVFLFNCTNTKPRLVNENYLSYFHKLYSKDKYTKWFIPDNTLKLSEFLKKHKV